MAHFVKLYAKLLAMIVQHWVFLVTCWQYANRSFQKAAKTKDDGKADIFYKNTPST